MHFGAQKSASELVADIRGHIGHPAKTTATEDLACAEVMLNSFGEKALTQPNIVIGLRVLDAISSEFSKAAAIGVARQRPSC